MAARGHAEIEDILLLFIYLELGAMVGIYFTTNHMPVRFLIYVALTALTRLLIGMANLEHVDLENAIENPHYGLIVVTGGILLLSIAVLILRYASYSYPSARRFSASGATAGSDDMALPGPAFERLFACGPKAKRLQARHLHRTRVPAAWDHPRSSFRCPALGSDHSPRRPTG